MATRTAIREVPSRFSRHMLIVSTDCSKKEGKGAGVGWVIEDNTGEISSGCDYIGSGHTSEEAEAAALLRGIREALREGRQHLHIRCDCMPVVCKVKNNDDISGYVKRIHVLLRQFESWRIQWVPREKNTEADSKAHAGFELPTH